MNAVTVHAGKMILFPKIPDVMCRKVGTANFIGQDPFAIHGAVWAVIGNEGDSQCYLGGKRKS